MGNWKRADAAMLLMTRHGRGHCQPLLAKGPPEVSWHCSACSTEPSFLITADHFQKTSQRAQSLQ